MGEPLFYLVAFGLGMGSYMGLFGGKSYLYFLVPGIVTTSVMLASTFECLYGTFVKIVHEKIYDSIIVTPISAEDAVAGDILWGTFRGMISGILMIMAGAILGVAPASLWGIIVLILLLALVGLMFGSFAMIVTSFAPNFDFFNYYSELLIMPMFFFSGIFFPIDKMPEAVKIIAQIFPLYHAVSISRAAYSGIFDPMMFANIAFMLILWVIAFYFALIFMKRRLIK